MPKKSTQIVAKFDTICPCCKRYIYKGDLANAWKTGKNCNQWYHVNCYKKIHDEVFMERDKNREFVKEKLSQMELF